MRNGRLWYGGSWLKPERTITEGKMTERRRHKGRISADTWRRYAGMSKIKGKLNSIHPAIRRATSCNVTSWVTRESEVYMYIIRVIFPDLHTSPGFEPLYKCKLLALQRVMIPPTIFSNLAFSIANNNVLVMLTSLTMFGYTEYTHRLNHNCQLPVLFYPTASPQSIWRNCTVLLLHRVTYK